MSSALPRLARTSLDLNPIENMWNEAQNPQQHKKTTTKLGQKIMVQKVWNIITPEYLQSLYKSMPQPVQATKDTQDSDAKN